MWVETAFGHLVNLDYVQELYVTKVSYNDEIGEGWYVEGNIITGTLPGPDDPLSEFVSGPVVDFAGPFESFQDAKTVLGKLKELLGAYSLREYSQEDS